MQKLNSFFNLVRFNPFFGLGVITGQSGFVGFRRAIVVFFQAKVDVDDRAGKVDTSSTTITTTTTTTTTTSTTDSGTILCPMDWVGYGDKCFWYRKVFLSTSSIT